MEWMDLMDIEIEYKLYLIDQRIKSINGKVNMIMDGEETDITIEDANRAIEALTNFREMI
jgi:hypothetical protein